MSSIAPNFPEELFAQIFTPYGVSSVNKQLSLRSKVKINDDDDGMKCDHFYSSNGLLNVTVHILSAHAVR